jgi:membrane-associated phospholipid phosphatase
MQNLHKSPSQRDPSIALVWGALGAAAVLFLAIALAVATGATAATDVRIGTWLHAHAAPLLTDLMAAISFVGAPTTLTAVAIAGGLFLMYRRKFAESVTLAIIVIGGNLLNVGLKHLVQRGRPVFDEPLLSLPTYSFPSGHAMASTVFFGLLALHAMEWTGRRAAARVEIGAAVSMIALVCFSRVYLGLHYPSDVVGGVAEGMAWLAVSWIILQSMGRSLAGSRR